MNKIILALLSFSLVLVWLKLSAATDSDKDYHLVQSQIADEVPSGGRVDSATVYVLVCPGERVYVFRALQSPQMEEVIGRFPRGSVLHYHTHGLTKPPSQAQLGALTAFCKSKGISLSGPYSIN